MLLAISLIEVKRVNPSDNQFCRAAEIRYRRRMARPSIRSHFMELPPELFILIVELACRGNLAFPWTLSQVNRACRALALGTRSLWSTIDLHIGLQRATQQLSRSGSAPLTISCRAFSKDEARDGLALLKALPDGAAHCLTNLQFVCMYNSQDIFEDLLSLLSTKDLSQLECLDVGFCQTFINTGLRPDVNLTFQHTSGIGTSSSALKHLTLRDFCMKKHEITLFTGLRSLSIVRMEMSRRALREIVEASKDLHSLRIETLDYSSSHVTDAPDILEDIHLPSLQNAEFIHIHKASRLRSIIHAPAIERLVYKPAETSSLWDLRRGQLQPEQQLPILPEPDMPLANLERIRTLVLVDCPMASGESWATLFHSLPRLEDLSLSGCDLTGVKLGSLASAGGLSSLPCATLAHLTIEDDFTLQSSAVLDVVKARIHCDAPHLSSIRTVALRRWPPYNIQAEDVAAIEALVAAVSIEALYDEDDHSDTDSFSSKDTWYYEFEYESSDSESRADE